MRVGACRCVKVRVGVFMCVFGVCTVYSVQCVHVGIHVCRCIC